MPTVAANARKMKDAEIGDAGQVSYANFLSEMLFDVFENTPQLPAIQTIPRSGQQLDELGLGVCV